MMRSWRWRTAIRIGACRPARSSRRWPMRAVISPRNRASTGSCGLPTSNTTGVAARPRNGGRLSTHCATGPNQVWCWDITWLPGPARGLFYYLYLILDLYSRKILAWEVHETEAGDLAAKLIHQVCLAEVISARPLGLHSDNGAGHFTVTATHAEIPARGDVAY